jgi:hypothetical protein
MKKPALATGLICLGFVGWNLFNKEEPPNTPRSEMGESPPASLTSTPEEEMALKALAGYASELTSAEEDLELFHLYIENIFLLIKNRNSAHYANNEDLSNYLRGKNSELKRLIPDNSPIFDQEYRIVDRWGTPLHIHMINNDGMELRSGGPDRQLFTEDDLEWPKKEIP